MPDSSGLLKNNFQSPAHACSSFHAHIFCMPESPLSTLNLPLENRSIRGKKKGAETEFSTVPVRNFI